jgi:hypothetical protein
VRLLLLRVRLLREELGALRVRVGVRMGARP